MQGLSFQSEVLFVGVGQTVHGEAVKQFFVRGIEFVAQQGKIKRRQSCANLVAPARMKSGGDETEPPNPSQQLKFGVRRLSPGCVYTFFPHGDEANLVANGRSQVLAQQTATADLAGESTVNYGQIRFFDPPLNELLLTIPGSFFIFRHQNNPGSFPVYSVDEGKISILRIFFQKRPESMTKISSFGMARQIGRLIDDQNLRVFIDYLAG